MKKTAAVFTVFCMLLSFFCLPVSAEGTVKPVIVDTVYPTDDIVIADIIVTEAPYFADNTGKTDASAVIQRAIDDCSKAGGGTVFLPVGEYLLQNSLYIRPFTALIGDYTDPDLKEGYGTVILADVPSVDKKNPALIKIGASAGVRGLTVYYPDQNIDNVLPYPYTFFVEGNGDYMLSSITDCTLINSYRGIGVSAECEEGIYQCHEMFTLENVKGTCLYEGLSAHNSADVDTVKTLYLLNDYWAQAGERFSAPEKEKIDRYTREHGYGLVLGDIEWPQFSDVKISDRYIGIDFREGIRYCFSGEFTDLYIEKCTIGMNIPDGFVQKRGESWGTAVTSGVIEGSRFAVYAPGNDSLILTDVDIKGIVFGKEIRRYYTDLSHYAPSYDKTYEKPVSVLYTVNADKTGHTDASRAVQKMLDEAGKTGGVVYLPAGLYRFDGPVSVPSGVEFRGSSSVPTRCQGGNSGGTLIYSVYGYGEDHKPLVSLGEGSGISGLRFDYPENAPTDDSGAYKKTSPVIYSESDNVYIVNCFITLASTGIELNSSDNAFIKKVIGCCFDKMFSIKNSDNVFIEGCLQNGNTLPRNGYKNFDIPLLQGRFTEDKLFDFVFIPITRIHTNYIEIESSRNVTVFNSFIYGGKSFMKAEDSTVLVYNTGHDGSSKTEPAFILSGTDAVLINTMRSTSDGKLGQNFFALSNGASLRSFASQAVDMLYSEHIYFENISLSELRGTEILYGILQPLYRLIRFFGNIHMVNEQG